MRPGDGWRHGPETTCVLHPQLGGHWLCVCVRTRVCTHVRESVCHRDCVTLHVTSSAGHVRGPQSFLLTLICKRALPAGREQGVFWALGWAQPFCVRSSKLPRAATNSRIRGWVGALGPLLHDLSSLEKIICSINTRTAPEFPSWRSSNEPN